MRSLHWLFLVSIALFISGIAFVIAAARMAPEPARAESAPIAPVASVKQLMNGIITPAARDVFSSVATIITADRVEERAPKTDEEWQAVGNSAAALAEAGNLLMIESRAVDQGDWLTMSKALLDSAQVVMKAIEAKSPSDLMASGEAIVVSCDNCHLKYQRQ